MKKTIFAATLSLVCIGSQAAENTFVCRFVDGSQNFPRHYNNITYKVYTTNDSKILGTYISLSPSFLGNTKETGYAPIEHIMANKNGTVPPSGRIFSSYGVTPGSDKVRYVDKHIYGVPVNDTIFTADFNTYSGKLHMSIQYGPTVYEKYKNQWGEYSCTKMQSLLK
jgi:hypothetical protein